MDASGIAAQEHIRCEIAGTAAGDRLGIAHEDSLTRGRRGCSDRRIRFVEGKRFLSGVASVRILQVGVTMRRTASRLCE
jgi:hypothetical protein